MHKNVLITAVCFLIIFGIIMRLLPHAPNMTPITAIAFVGGLYLGKKWAFALPLGTLLLSDLLLGTYDWRIMLSVYGAFACIGLFGLLAARYRAVLPVGLLVIGSSLLFFLITNAAVWAFSPWYAKDITGLMYAYELGLPFLRNMLLGDIIYTATLVGAFESIRLMYASHQYLLWRLPSAAAARAVRSILH